jgi:Tol biopolymer transport system component
MSDEIPSDFLASGGLDSTIRRLAGNLIGTQIGAYEITALLGAGGMGEVYRARDTKLGRDVAMKVLPPAFTTDADRVARFQREAKVLASLNHPNIGAIYGFEDGRALVLELVEGETLEEKLAGRPLRLDDALRIARAIANALDAAHEKGVIHRDLKPANIKIAPGGMVKVLDFGLAKFARPASDSALQPSGLTEGPAMSRTEAGMILGTAAYMSPEQARAEAVDKRTDIWAFGCVLYEMLSGKQAFPGSTVSDSIAAILEREPDWKATPASTPVAVQRVLRRCLEKDPKRRLRDIGEAVIVLEGGLEGGVDVLGPETPTRRSAWARAMPLAVAVMVGALGAAAAVWQWKASPAPPVIRSTFPIPALQQAEDLQWVRPIIAISADAARIAYAVNGRLYTKSLNAMDAVEIAGSRVAGGIITTLGFSPDGKWIAYWDSGVGAGALRKISVAGGSAVTLCEMPLPNGLSWDNDGILVGQRGGVARVPTNEGSSPLTVLTVPKGYNAYAPQLLPDGRTILYTLGQTFAEMQVVLQKIGSEVRQVVASRGAGARYLSTGHILYGDGETLFAIRFDPATEKATGDPVPVVEGVKRRIAGAGGPPQFALSDSGSLLYVSDLGTQSGRERTLTWVSRIGEQQPIPAEPRDYLYPRISPDGSRVALQLRDEQQDIWVWNFRQGSLSKITFNPAQDKHPVWTPDGQHLLFASARDTPQQIYRIVSDAAGGEERLHIEREQLPNDVDVLAVAPDGKLVIRTIDPKTRHDLYLMALNAATGIWKPTVLLRSPFSENNAAISPDGRWMAYESDESGRFEIYVRPFPNVRDARLQISTEGGVQPAWARSGSELYYVKHGGSTDAPLALMAVTAPRTEAGGKFGVPSQLFVGRYYTPRTGGDGFRTGRMYDVSPDDRFLMIVDAPVTSGVGQPQIALVVNWSEELKQRVPR